MKIVLGFAVSMVVIFVVTIVLADTYYIRYDKKTGKQWHYSTDFPAHAFKMSTNGWDFTEPPMFDTILSVGFTTNNPDGKTNISQYSDFTPLKAIDLVVKDSANSITTSNEVLKIWQAVYNKKNPTNQITEEELFVEATNQIKKAKDKLQEGGGKQ